MTVVLIARVLRAIGFQKGLTGALFTRVRVHLSAAVTVRR